MKARAAKWVRVLAGLLCGLALLGGDGRDAAAGPPGRELPSWVDAPDRVYFPETGHHLVDPFLYYWRANGGRAVFGLPISESRAGAGGQSTVQYFERAVLEYRPNVGGATELVPGRDAVTGSSVNLRTGPGTQYGKVLVLPRERRVRLVGGPLPDADGAPWFEIAGSFGTGWSKGEFLERREDAVDIATPLAELVAARAVEPAFRRLAPLVVGALGPDTDDLAVFPSTGHALAAPFKRFWEAHGGAFAFGLPVSEPFSEVSRDDGKPYTVQYFERAKLEYHPEAAGTEAEVQPAALGRWAAGAAGVSTAPVKRAPGVGDYDEGRFQGPKWIEVNLSEQRLTAWDGDLIFITTLIRSGKPDWQTPVGTFRTFQKVPVTDMTLGREGIDDWYYFTPDVPWVMYFLPGGFAIHGAVWDDAWGTPTSHGCVNVPADLARALYDWAPLGTIVWIHY